MPGFRRRCAGWFILTWLLFSFSYASDISILYAPDWSITGPIESIDGYAELSWSVDSDQSVDFYKLFESGPAGSQAGFVEGRELSLFRISPGSYRFTVQACKRSSELEPVCGPHSEYLDLHVSDSLNEIYEVREGLASWPIEIIGWPIDGVHGPRQLRPGLWYNPDREGQGWSFHWSSRRTLPESHDLFGDAYDLVGFWYTFEAKSRFIEGPPPCGEGGFGPECYWAYDNYLPLAASLKLVRSSENTYSGGIYIHRNGQDLHVGSATIVFGSSSQQASISWNASFRWQQISSEESIVHLAGATDSSPGDISHYSGVWKTPGRDDLTVIHDVGVYSEAVQVLFQDGQGDPGWLQASVGTAPVVTETPLCFYYVSSGFAPGSAGNFIVADDGCQSGLPASDENLNGKRAFLDFEAAGLWLDYKLPAHLERGSVRFGSASEPLSLEKIAGIHRITHRLSVEDGCETNSLSEVCAVEASWFSAGDIPELSIFDFNRSTGVRQLVASGVDESGMLTVNLSGSGEHILELRMSPSSSSSLVAQSESLTVESVMVPTPSDLQITWIDQNEFRYRLDWEYPDTASVVRFIVETQPPGDMAAEERIVEQGSGLSAEFQRESGPFGLYRVRILACHPQGSGEVCSNWSEPISWVINEPDGSRAVTDRPWGDFSQGVGILHTDVVFDYVMGYHFRPEVDGQIVELGGMFNGTRQVRLYRRSDGQLLRQAWIESANEWTYVDVESLPVSAGEEYTVAVDVDGEGGSYRAAISLPVTNSNITIIGSTYGPSAAGPDSPPVNLVQDRMYGQADIGFTEDAALVNSPPFLPGLLEDQVNSQGDEVALEIPFEDPDGDQVSCVSQGLPDGLNLMGGCRVEGRVEATPGSYAVEVTASDGIDSSEPASFEWIIHKSVTAANPDQPPEPAARPDFQVDLSSARVGYTAGSAAVDAFGAAIYRVEVMTAPGSGGFAPSISLEYNSQSPNGVVGMGWSIGGQSAITRCAQTMEQDGTPTSRGIGIDLEDRFCLDGKRLMLVSGEYGRAGSEYRTEIDQFNRIRAFGSAGQGPAYFTVWSKDGTVREYGLTPDSRIEIRSVNDSQTVVTWAMNRQKDASGNYADYRYLEDSAGSVDFALESVHYTGNLNAGTKPYAEIRFIYSENREDVTETFSKTSSFATSRLLKRIESVSKIEPDDSDQQSLRSYFLQYGEDGYGRKTLEELQECSDSSRFVCFPATSFSWLKTEHGISRRYTPLADDLFTDALVGLNIADINGDGRQDLLITENGSTATFSIALATPDGGFMLSTERYPLPKDTEDRPFAIYPIDLNADGFHDVIYPRKTVSTKFDKVSVVSAGSSGWNARLSNGISLGREILVATDCCNVDNPAFVRIMDFDGDGLSDLVTLRHTYGNETNGDLVVLLNDYQPGGQVGFRQMQKLEVDLATTLFPQGPTTDGWTRDDLAPQFVNANPASAAGAQPFDFNGDGRVDMLSRISRRYVKCDSNCPLPVFNRSSYLAQNSFEFGKAGDSVQGESSSSRGTQYAWATFYVVFEADGSDRYREKAVIATGAGEDCSVAEACSPFDSLPDARILVPVDINSDGLADVAFQGSDDSWYFMLNSGGEFLEPRLITTLSDSELGKRSRFLDVNGDGFPDLIYPEYLDDSSTHWVLHVNDGGREFAASVRTLIRHGDQSRGEFSILADFSGDGMLDNLTNSGSSEHSTSRRRGAVVQLGENLITGIPAQASNVITRVKTGLGSITRFEYLPLTNPRVYKRTHDGSQANWGRGSAVLDMMAPLYVVSRHSASAPTFTNPSAESATEYHYVGGKIQAGGRGFLGFAEVIAYDPKSSTRQNSRYRQDFPFAGLLSESAVVVAGNNTKFRSILDHASTVPETWPQVTESVPLPERLGLEKVIRYQLHQWGAVENSGSASVFSRQMVRTLDRNFTLQRSQSRKSYTRAEFNSNGNIVESTTEIWGGDYDLYSKTVTHNTYSLADLGNWNLGFKTGVLVTHERPGVPRQTRRTVFEYHDASRKLAREVLFPDIPSLQLVREFSVDQFGNRTSTHTHGLGMESRSIDVWYDSLGRFADGQRNGFGQITKEVFERDVFGNIVRSSDIDGVESEFLFDSMGRQFAGYTETGTWSSSKNILGSGNNCPGEAVHHRVTITGDGSRAIACFDIVGREFGSAKTGFDGRYIRQERYFDIAGRLERESMPTMQASRLWTRHQYDQLGRPKSTRTAGGNDLEYFWNEQAGNQCLNGSVRMMRVRNALGQDKTEIRNPLGELTRVVDAECGALSYEYDAIGQVTVVTGVDGVVTRMSYDRAGRKVVLDDPDRGRWQYRYNPVGEVLREYDAKNQAVDFEYDREGRQVHRRELTDVPSITSSSGIVVGHEQTIWQNSSQSTAFGKGKAKRVDLMSGENGPLVHRVQTAYDAYGRVEEALITVDGETFVERHTFDQLGRPFQDFDVSGDSRGMRYVYSPYGHLSQVREAREGDEGVVYQTILAMDAFGNVSSMQFGNGVTVHAAYRPDDGTLERLEAYDARGVEIQEVDYLFNVLGSLKQRQDRTAGRELLEEFTYDDLNRLIRVELTAPAYGITTPAETMKVNYNSAGNIVFKTGIGSYQYGDAFAGPHAVRYAAGDTYAYDLNGNQISGGGRSITYNVSNKPNLILKSGQRTEFVYGIGQSRVIRVDDNIVDGQQVTYYLGSTRLIRSATESKYRRMLGEFAQSDYFPASGQSQTRYFIKDHLGSPHAITDESGLLEKTVWMSFDAFGKRRDISWLHSLSNGALQSLADLTSVGFTGHEHVDASGLIHMNGRIYDPELGRFLQADPIVQSPDNGQSLNRYSYVLNNPLSYTDPSGYLGIKRFFKRWGRLIAALVIGFILPGSSGILATQLGITGPFAQAGITGFIAGGIGSGSFKGAVIGAITAMVVTGIVRSYSSPKAKTKLAPPGEIMPTEASLMSNYGENGPPEGLYRILVESNGRIDSFSSISATDIQSGDVIFTNGMKNNFRKAVLNATSNINQAGLLKGSYVLNFNATKSVLADLAEASVDVIGAHTGLAQTALARNLASAIHTASQNGVTGLHLLGHSQGGAITASAIRYAGKAGLNLSALKGGSLAFHGAPVNAWYAKTKLGNLTGADIFSRYQLGDAVHVFGGLNFRNPLDLPISILRAPHLFSGDAGLSPHSVPCLGGRGAICAP